MLFLNKKKSSDPGIPRKHEVADGCHWNLWKRKIYPFEELNSGPNIVIVHSWPGGGRLTWEVEPVDLVTAQYSSKKTAIKLIATALNLNEAEVNANEYTKDGPSEGYLLAFCYHPVRRLCLPRPQDMKMGGHGWLKVDDLTTLRNWGLTR